MIIERLNYAVTQLKMELEKGDGNIDRLMTNVALLTAKLKEAQEYKTVMVPRDVAAAIESYRDEGNDTDYIVRMLSDNSIHNPVARLKALRSFARDNGFLLISALLNGYNAGEPTKEERLYKRLREKFGDLAEEITEAINNFNAETHG